VRTLIEKKRWTVAVLVGVGSGRLAGLGGGKEVAVSNFQLLHTAVDLELPRTVVHVCACTHFEFSQVMQSLQNLSLALCVSSIKNPWGRVRVHCQAIQPRCLD
jgi:hypothetical protein